MKSTRKFKVIGAGGIGSHLVEPLARFLSLSLGDNHCELTVIDGDKFEEKNRARQRFVNKTFKSEETVSPLATQFPNVHFRTKTEYVTDANVVTSIRENDFVFLCVDNHATRKLVSDRCEELDNVTLISGGNDYTDGNVMIHIRRDGKNITRPMTALYPKSIGAPQDKNPGDVAAHSGGCQAEVESQPQLLFTNLAAASNMLNAFLAIEQNKAKFEQVYFDVITQCHRVTPELEI